MASRHVRAWAIVLDGQSIRQVPYTGPEQEGLLCYVHEGDKEWTRVARVVTTLLNHPHPNARHRGDEE